MAVSGCQFFYPERHEKIKQSWYIVEIIRHTLWKGPEGIYYPMEKKDFFFSPDSLGVGNTVEVTETKKKNKNTRGSLLCATSWEKPYIILAFSLTFYLFLFHKMRNWFSVTYYEFNTELTQGIIMLLLWC